MTQSEVKRKCVFVIGPESSGSKLIARVCAHVLGVAGFEDWDGGGWCDRGGHKVCHRSLPAGGKQVYPDIDAWIAANEADYELFFILTTRDITMSELSRFNRFRTRPMSCFQQQSEKAREIMQSVMDGDRQYMIWSYETFMFLQGGYLQVLYEFLGVKSVFLPPLADANAPKVRRPQTLRRFVARRLRQLKRRLT